MSQFLDKFDNEIRRFWNGSSVAEKRQLLDDILQYANSNSQAFENEIDEIRFDIDRLLLPIILEALSKDTANWGQFYVDLLDDIFEMAKQVENPNLILTNILEFAYIEMDEKPFIQKIADRLYKELSSENLETKLAAIWTIPGYLNNKAIRNKHAIIVKLEQLLNDSNWKVRVVTFKALSNEALLPLGHKLSFIDKFFKLILGEPKELAMKKQR